MPPQLPIPGADWQVWGGEINAFLEEALNNPGGTLKAPVLLAGSHDSAPNGRQLAGGGGISIDDAGPGSTISLAALVGAGLEIAAGLIRIVDGGVTAAKIGTSAVTTAKIADAAVSNAKLAGSIATSKIAWPGDTSKFIRADGSAQPVPAAIPTGMCLPYAANAAPPGTDFLPCDGAAVLRSTYENLFSVIGTTHGAGDGITTFNVPDMRGRVPVGKGVHADVDHVGDSDGAAASIRRPKHQHTVYDPGHKHKNADLNVAASGNARNGQNAFGTLDTATSTTGIKVNPEGSSISSSPVDAPSYLTLLWCIKT